MQKYANLVDLEKSCQTHIFLQNFVLIQPRTSPPKICKILQKTFISSPNSAAQPAYLCLTILAAAALREEERGEAEDGEDERADNHGSGEVQIGTGLAGAFSEYGYG